jgi:phage repressor protein C with HTH and peptisase S24 domain
MMLFQSGMTGTIRERALQNQSFMYRRESERRLLVEAYLRWRVARHGATKRIAMNAAAERLKSLRQLRGFSSGAELARAAGIPEATYRAYEGGGRPLTPRAAKMLARPLKVSWQIILFGHEDGAGVPATLEEAAALLGQSVPRKPIPPPPSLRSEEVEFGGERFVLLPVYEARAAAGAPIEGSDSVSHRTAFREDWLRRITRAPLDKLAVLTVDGDSMEPTLRHDDTVLIDLDQRRPTAREGIYVIRVDGGLQVKRVTAHPALKTLSVRSDNAAYAAFDGLAPDDVDVIGRVVWLGRQVGS